MRSHSAQIRKHAADRSQRKRATSLLHLSTSISLFLNFLSLWSAALPEDPIVLLAGCRIASLAAWLGAVRLTPHQRGVGEGSEQPTSSRLREPLRGLRKWSPSWSLESWRSKPERARERSSERTRELASERARERKSERAREQERERAGERESEETLKN